MVDSQDYCPDDVEEALSRGVANNGRPKHSDQDATPDYRDKCPDTPGKLRRIRMGVKYNGYSVTI